MRISDWSSDVCSSDLIDLVQLPQCLLALQLQLFGRLLGPLEKIVLLLRSGVLRVSGLARAVQCGARCASRAKLSLQLVDNSGIDRAAKRLGRPHRAVAEHGK